MGSGILWHTLAYSGILWHTLAYSGILWCNMVQHGATWCNHTSYLSFFLHMQNFWSVKFTLKKRLNYGKIHSKLPIFCVITAKYTVNCQIFALNLKKFTPAKKIYMNIFVGFVTNMRYGNVLVLYGHCPNSFR